MLDARFVVAISANYGTIDSRQSLTDKLQKEATTMTGRIGFLADRFEDSKTKERSSSWEATVVPRKSVVQVHFQTASIISPTTSAARFTNM